MDVLKRLVSTLDVAHSWQLFCLARKYFPGVFLVMGQWQSLIQCGLFCVFCVVELDTLLG